jgi:hypothetical protein
VKNQQQIYCRLHVCPANVTCAVVDVNLYGAAPAHKTCTNVCHCPFCNPRAYAILPTATRVHTRFTSLQPAYIRDSPSCNLHSYATVPTATCGYVRKPVRTLPYDLLHSYSFFLGQISQSYRHSLAEITNLAHVQTHLCQLHHVSTHTTQYEMSQ